MRATALLLLFPFVVGCLMPLPARRGNSGDTLSVSFSLCEAEVVNP